MRASSTRRRWPPDRVCSGWFSTRSGSPRLLPGGLGLGGVAAGRGQLGLGAGVGGHRLVADLVGLVAHGQAGPVETGEHGVQPARGEDPVLGQHVEVAGARVLRQVAHLAAVAHRAGGRGRLPGEDLGQRRLAGAVAPDEADLVARGDLEADSLQQQARSRAHLEILGDQHVLL
ncbi:hypothetical protein GCM10009714_02800 [Microlunatus capsulatus]